MVKVYKPENTSDWSGLYWHGNSIMIPREAPLCGWQGELCEATTNNNTLIIIVISLVCIALVIILLIVAALFKTHRYNVNLRVIDGVTFSYQELDLGDSQQNQKYVKAFCRDKCISISYLGQRSINIQDRRVLIDLKEMQELGHDNVNAFIGICSESPKACILMVYASRGRLCDIIADDEVSLSQDFKVSFILDIACGMWYLHQSPIQAHGHLTSAKCIIDNRWTCKITGHGMKYIKQQAGIDTEPQFVDDPSTLLWTAPELFNISHISLVQAKKGDVFSFAIIAQEIFLKGLPYAANSPELDVHDIIERVKYGPLTRPHIPASACSDKWVRLIQDCWQEDDDKRPTFNDILYLINSIQHYKNMDLIDNMIKRLERHTQNLEQRVAQRMVELRDEKVKVDILLHELLPESVAKQLSAGAKVQPETFDSVTIFFSDIVGFTKMSSRSTPLEVVNMLNGMYSMFDHVTQQFDVYKVATIGDAYMVASGVPLRNGDTHAVKICSLSLALLEAIQNLPIEHLPGEHLQMRIGIHSGPCVAGVAGIKMPRYLLFGDTVDIAEKLESGGKAMTIHISETTKLLISDNSNFNVKLRGEISIKGMMTLTTYWLSTTLF